MGFPQDEMSFRNLGISAECARIVSRSGLYMDHIAKFLC